MPPKKRAAQPNPVLHANLPLIEVAAPWLLDAILADSAASRHVLLRLSETIALVAPGELDALHARLRKLGHTPKVLAE
jgi:hypothetical protein